MAGVPDADLDDLVATIAVARLVLGPRMRHTGTAEPASATQHAAVLAAGIDDWGGVSPVTPDHVNPERPWPAITDLAAYTAAAGFDLAERLTAYPPYLAEPWLDPRLSAHVAALAGPDGLANIDARTGGPALAGTRRRPGQHRPHRPARQHRHHRPHRRPARRLRQCLRGLGFRPRGRHHRSRHRGTAPAGRGHRRRAPARRRSAPPGSPTPSTWRCCTPTGPLWWRCGTLADDVRRDTVGDDVTYVVNRNINFTNICYVGCRFCAFAQRRGDSDAYSLSLDELADRAEQAWNLGATEVCMQGGIDPKLAGTDYFDIVTAVKARVPGIHVHAFSPMEIVTAAGKAGMSITEWLTAARDAGLDTIPGTAAEILDDDIRWILTKGKLPAATWIEVVSTAHRLGIRSSSTMMYGHVDAPRHWVAHLRTLARHPGRHRRFHRIRAPAVRAHQRPALPGRRRPTRTHPPGERRRPRRRPAPAARPDRPHPNQLGQARRRRHPHHAHRRRRRPRRHPDGRNHQPDGRIPARLRENRRRTHRHRRAPPAPQHPATQHHLRPPALSARG